MSEPLLLDQPVNDGATPAVAASLEVLPTRVLVVSAGAGTAEMVARSVAEDPHMEARSLRCRLSDLSDHAQAKLDQVDLIMFEIASGDDAELRALRGLRANGHDRLKFLGITYEPLSMALARQLMEAGVDDVLPLGTGKPELQDAAPIAPAEQSAQFQRGGTVRNGVITVVTRACGGIGATSFALNLAALLAQPASRSADPDRVAVVDLDFQNGVLGAAIDVEDNGAYVDFLKSGQPADYARIRSMMVPWRDRFDVLAAPREIAPLDAMTPPMMASLLDELRLSYDHVIVDMPRAVAEWFGPVLARADRMYVLSDLSVHSVRQMRRMIDTFSEDNVSMPIELVSCMEKRPLRLPEAAREAEKFLNRKLAHWVPRDDRTARKAIDGGEPMVLANPRSSVVKALTPILKSVRELAALDQRRQA